MGQLSYISAVIITYNEEKYIDACIRSLLPVVDEVVIVDSHSTDSTVSIAESHGASVISTDWQGYAATKNLGNKAATHPWILSIDADELLSESLQKSIATQKENGFTQSAVYQFNRRNNYCGQWMKYAGWYPDEKVRIFGRDTSRWEGDVHEQLVHAQSVETIHLAGDLLHYSIVDKQDHISRIKKYNKLAKPFSSGIKAYVSAIATFIKLYVTKLGFLDGKLGFQLCYLSARGKIWRQKKHLQ